MKSDDRRQILSAMATAGNFGITMVACLAVGLFLGRATDNWLGSAPWGAAGGALLGAVAGMWSAYKRIVR